MADPVGYAHAAILASEAEHAAAALAARFAGELREARAALARVHAWADGPLPAGRTWPGNSADVYSEAQVDVRLILAGQHDPPDGSHG